MKKLLFTALFHADAYFIRGNSRFDRGDNRGAISDMIQAAELFCQQGQMNSYRQAMKLVKQFKSAK
jgi:hypothetical protein